VTSMVRCEIRKAFYNRWFIVSLAIGCMLTVVSAAGNIVVEFHANELGIEHLNSKFLDFSSSSCFKYWLVVDFIQPTTSLFFQLLPLLAALPFSWSYLEESKVNYVASMITRTTRVRYCLSKYFVVFLTGALVITIPIVLNFLICACFMPMRMPDVFAVIYFGVYEKSLWSEIFYTNPLFYVALFSFLNFIFSGVWAAFVFALSGLIKNKAALIILPYLSLVYIDFISKRVLADCIRIELTPFGFLRGVGAGFAANGYVVTIIIVGVLLMSIVGTFLISRKDFW